MCLGIPMKIKKIQGDFACVETGQLSRTINIQMLSSVCVGDYVIVHAGFAIEKVDPEKAKDTLRIIDEPRTFFTFNYSRAKKERGENIARTK